MDRETFNLIHDTRQAVLRSAEARARSTKLRLEARAVNAASHSAVAASAVKRTQVSPRLATCWFRIYRPFNREAARSICFCPTIRAIVPNC